MLRTLGLIVSSGIAALLAAPALHAAPLSLLDERFSVEAQWRTPDGATGSGTPVALTRETGYFWFFSPTNVEVVVKVLEGCGVNDRFWVFAGGLTNLDVTLTVTDETNGTKKVYDNPQGTPFAPLQDTGAFATCALERCGRGRLADLAASPRARKDLEAMAGAMAGTVAAPQAVYDRVVADVAALGARDFSLNSLPFQRNFETSSLYVEVDFATAQAIAGGNYTPWDCLNRRYGLRQVSQYPPSTVLLWFDKVLDVRQLVADYEALPGVTTAEPQYNQPYAPIPIPQAIISSFCGRIEGNLYRYYARFSTGAIFHYTTLPGAAPVLIGSTEVGVADPSWLAEANACFAEHVDPLS